jgi:hypothetical protein
MSSPGGEETGEGELKTDYQWQVQLGYPRPAGRHFFVHSQASKKLTLFWRLTLILTIPL